VVEELVSLGRHQAAVKPEQPAELVRVSGGTETVTDL
jgi:hypothetical protein